LGAIRHLGFDLKGNLTIVWPPPTHYASMYHQIAATSVNPRLRYFGGTFVALSSQSRVDRTKPNLGRSETFMGFCSTLPKCCCQLSFYYYHHY